MMKRDLKADLELCNRATPGPWIKDERVGCVAVYPASIGKIDYLNESGGKCIFYKGGVRIDDERGIFKHWTVKEQDIRDAEFVAHAREGWPHAIERAIKAEKALGNETILNGKALAKLNERADKAETLARELVEALKKAHEYIGDINSFYGQGLQVHGWHFNGAPEPLDNFIDDNGGCEVEEFVGRVLTKAKEVLEDEKA